MFYPKFIQKNDSIGITAPSDGVVEKLDLYRLNSAISQFQEKGFHLVETQNVRKSIKGRSSTSKEQAKQLESLFNNEKISSIFCVAGGEFLLEMLSYFHFDIVKDHPKWLQGYSDPTGLLFTITTNLDIATIYGNNFKAFGMRPWHDSLKNNLEILKGNMILQNSFNQYEIERQEYITGDEPYHLEGRVIWKNLRDEKKITMNGRMIGGCIDVLTELFGTRFDQTKKFIKKYKDDGIIWYFDHCELSSEALIRTFWKFKDNGWFSYTKGIIFGRSMTNNSYYDISLKEAILHSLGDLDIPIIIDADLGHVSPRMTIINGAVATIHSHNGEGTIEFQLK